MAVERLNNEIRFYYTMDELFDAQALWSAYKADMKVDGEGESMVDKFTATIDEKDIVTSILSDSVYDIFPRFLKYTGGIIDSIGFDENFTPSGGVQTKCAWLKIKDHANFNINYLNPIDKILEKTLRFHALRDWFLLKDLDADAQKAAAAYDMALHDLIHQAFQLKKVSI